MAEPSSSYCPNIPTAINCKVADNSPCEDRWTDGRTDGWTDGQMDGQTDERMDGRVDCRTDGRMDGATN